MTDSERSTVSGAQRRAEAVRQVRRRFRYYVVFSVLIAVALALAVEALGVHFGLWARNPIVIVLVASTAVVLSAARYYAFMRRFRAEIKKVDAG